ncbi:MAG TPA: hypothetical protein VHW44_08955 [Pseudonocardiaceae bacterium]|nr:hypothetical protein [Pseudonocardiaceae bacterium]
MSPRRQQNRSTSPATAPQIRPSAPTRQNTRTGLAALITTLSALALTGCTALVVGNPLTPPGAVPTNTAESGAVALPDPVALANVINPTACGSPGAVPDTQHQACYLLDPPFLQLHRLDSVDVFPDNYPDDRVNSFWTVDLKLIPTDAQTVSTWTTANVSHDMAVVVNGVVLAAPTVQAPILGDDIQITGPYSENDANTLVRQLSGK